MQLEVSNLYKEFKSGEQQQSILKNVNLSINKGEVIALIGPSGSGKTTLLNLISGIDEPDKGEIYWQEESETFAIHTLKEPQKTLFRRHSLGFVFQFFNLIPTLSVKENILFPLELCGLNEDKSISLIEQLLSQLSIADKRDEYPDKLSGGEQQRVAIARALIHQPKLLLADEPTGNLDHETGIKVMTVFLELVKNHQMTLLLVTHSMEIAEMADRVFAIIDGQLIEQN